MAKDAVQGEGDKLLPVEVQKGGGRIEFVGELRAPDAGIVRVQAAPHSLRGEAPQRVLGEVGCMPEHVIAEEARFDDDAPVPNSEDRALLVDGLKGVADSLPPST